MADQEQEQENPQAPSTPLPESILTRETTVFGVPVRVHILSNGARVIEGNAMAAIFAKMQDGVSKEEENDMYSFAKWLQSLPTTAADAGKDV